MILYLTAANVKDQNHLEKMIIETEKEEIIVTWSESDHSFEDSSYSVRCKELWFETDDIGDVYAEEWMEKRNVDIKSILKDAKSISFEFEDGNDNINIEKVSLHDHHFKYIDITDNDEYKHIII